MSMFLENHARRLEDLRRRIAEAKEADRFGVADHLQRDTKRYLDQFLVDLFVRVGLFPPTASRSTMSGSRSCPGRSSGARSARSRPGATSST